ncbi:MAG: peroxiredoxin [Gammaproteobacteria bacterium]|nr:peroxiredoxin [Gammaproteobacteria bacterium]
MLEKNQVAPGFSVPNQANKTVNLADYKGNNTVVLYFYPKDDTPGCTIEANQFTERAILFANADAVVLGVSKDNCISHQAFIDKYGLKVELLADTTGELCEAYGVWQEKEKNGVKTMGIVRSTFIIDKHGLLVQAHYGVTPDGHAEDVLKVVQALQAAEAD